MTVFKKLLNDYRDCLLQGEHMDASAAYLALIKENASMQSRLEEINQKVEGLEKENASLKQDAARYRWLRDQKGLRLESDNMVWTRLDGSKYTSTHYLAANGTCHASLESLDLTVDTAMQYNKETNA